MLHEARSVLRKGASAANRRRARQRAEIGHELLGARDPEPDPHHLMRKSLDLTGYRGAPASAVRAKQIEQDAFDLMEKNLRDEIRKCYTCQVNFVHAGADWTRPVGWRLRPSR